MNYTEAMQLGMGFWREPRATGKQRIQMTKAYNPLSHTCEEPAAAVRPSIYDLPRGRRAMAVRADSLQPNPITSQPHMLRPQHLVAADNRVAKPLNFRF